VSQRQEAPGSGAGAWGWRALIAFVAGGLLTASGFAVAQLSDGGSQLAASDTTADTSVQDVASSIEPTTTVPPETTTSSTAPPTDGAVEPAVAVAALLGPSVVQLETNFGIGSGVIYGDGLILTNAHVVEDASSLSVQLSDGRHLTGEVVGTEPNVDIAVVSVGAGQELPIATRATGGVVRVGQTAIAIGSPFSLQQSVTEGIVSAVGRPVLHGTSVTAMIQTDAPINPGNSGGALADLNGRVIGINTAIQTDGTSGSNAGVGFAIPIDTAISVADRLVAGIPIEPGFLGIRGGESTDGSAGVEVTEVTSGSAAETAGLVVGDRILSIDGAPVSQFQELAGLVVARSPGDVVELEVIRNGVPVTIAVTLGTRPEDG
jgi:S1-C subfamily serine protease